jgi:hypothetical protein
MSRSASMVLALVAVVTLWVLVGIFCDPAAIGVVALGIGVILAGVLLLLGIIPIPEQDRGIGVCFMLYGLAGLLYGVAARKSGGGAPRSPIFLAGILSVLAGNLLRLWQQRRRDRL